MIKIDIGGRATYFRLWGNNQGIKFQFWFFWDFETFQQRHGAVPGQTCTPGVWEICTRTRWQPKLDRNHFNSYAKNIQVSAIHERVIQGNANTSIFNQTMKYSLTALALMLCVRRHSTWTLLSLLCLTFILASFLHCVMSQRIDQIVPYIVVMLILMSGSISILICSYLFFYCK